MVVDPMVANSGRVASSVKAAAAQAGAAGPPLQGLLVGHKDTLATLENPEGELEEFMYVAAPGLRRENERANARLRFSSSDSARTR